MIYLVKKSVLIFLFCVCVDANACSSVILNMKKTATVINSDVYIKDIATVDCANKIIQDKLNNISLGKAPLASYTISISQSHLHNVIKRSAWFDNRKIIITGASQTVVNTDLNYIEVAEYEQLAARHIQSLLGKVYPVVTISSVGINKRIAVPNNAYTIVPSKSKVNKFNSRMAINLDIYSNKKHYTTIPVWFDVKVKKKVYRAKKNIKKDSQIHMSDLEHDLVSSIKLNVEKDSVELNLDNVVLVNNVVAQQIITSDMVIPVADVISGQMVTVLVEHGNVKLRAKAVAQESGNIGSRIKLKNNKSNKTFQAIVIGKSLARSI